MSDQKDDVKSQVQKFYDDLGWSKQEGDFVDAVLFEDLRPVSRDYIHNCHLRVKEYIHPSGRFLLDAASGPVQYPEYLEYSRGYKIRVCVDISRQALVHARKRLGANGLYILADVASLPFQTDSMDGFVSLHTIYHVDQQKQEQAIRELHRVLKPGTTGVIVYSWGNQSPLTKSTVNLVRFFRYLPGRILRFLLGRRPPAVPQQDRLFYSHMHNKDWFDKISWGFPLEILVWRTPSVDFLKMFIHPWLFGKPFLRLLYRLEQKFPHFFGRYGHYPLIIVRK